MTTKVTETKARQLVKMAMKVTGEGEMLDLSDEDFTLKKLVELKAHLSHQRKGIDMVNKALAIYWDEEHYDEVYEEQFTRWKVGITKGKRIIDDTKFFEWLATKSAVELSKIVSASAVKVGGMSPAERDTLLDETPTNMNLSITSSRRY